jgi:hypothetical protein
MRCASRRLNRGWCSDEFGHGSREHEYCDGCACEDGSVVSGFERECDDGSTREVYGECGCEEWDELCGWSDYCFGGVCFNLISIGLRGERK